MTIVDPAEVGYNDELLVTQTDDKAIVQEAGKRIAFERRYWGELVSASYHPELMVEGGATFHDTEDGSELRMSVGVEGEGIGVVTYRVAKTTRDWILLERVTS